MNKRELTTAVENLRDQLSDLRVDTDSILGSVVENQSAISRLREEVTPAILLASGDVAASAAGEHDPLGTSDAIAGVPVPLLRWATAIIASMGEESGMLQPYDHAMLNKLRGFHPG